MYQNLRRVPRISDFDNALRSRDPGARQVVENGESDAVVMPFVSLSGGGRLRQLSIPASGGLLRSSDNRISLARLSNGIRPMAALRRKAFISRPECSWTSGDALYVSDAGNNRVILSLKPASVLDMGRSLSGAAVAGGSGLADTTLDPHTSAPGPMEIVSRLILVNDTIAAALFQVVSGKST